jgi:hypothetical protein
MVNILQLPHEILTIIFGLLDEPENIFMTCRSLQIFSKDPAVISSWILCDPIDRIRSCPSLIFEIPVLERLVCIYIYFLKVVRRD